MRSKILPGYCTSGRKLEELGGAIVHYFSAKNVDPENMFDLETCRDLFLDLNRPKAGRERFMKSDKWPVKRMYASAHLMIDREGETWRLVEYDRQAYHAGASILHGRPSCNRWTIGIELLGTQDSGFTSSQYRELAKICAELEIHQDNIAGHDLVRFQAIQEGSSKRHKYDPSGRKDGQGDNFQWDYFHHLLNEQELLKPGAHYA
ncbi:MAG: N-acetylmuramoyl-L-alanine amidase [Pseudohongiellaceae bacterium]